MKTIEERKKVCLSCGKIYISRTSHQKYCSRACNTEFNTRFIFEPYSLPSGIVGTIAELKVSIDLFERGYHVFRALSPNCPGDLIALKNGQMKIVEVTSGVKIHSGKINYLKHEGQGFDIIAVSVRGEGISYFDATYSPLQP